MATCNCPAGSYDPGSVHEPYCALRAAHPRLANPDNPAEGLCEWCATAWPCPYEQLRAENERLRWMLAGFVECADQKMWPSHKRMAEARHQIAGIG